MSILTLVCLLILHSTLSHTATITLVPGQSVNRAVTNSQTDTLRIQFRNTSATGGIRFVFYKSDSNAKTITFEAVPDGSGGKELESTQDIDSNGVGTSVWSVWPAQDAKVYTVKVSTTSVNAAYSATALLFCDRFSYPTVFSDLSTTCVSCPENGQARDATTFQAEECICQSGFHSATGLAPCDLCPYGGDCSGTETVTSQIPSAKSYLRLPQTLLSMNSVPQFVKCPVPESCLGGGSDTTSTECGTGYEGLLCDECREGWWRLGWECRECRQLLPWLPFALTIVGFALVSWGLYFYGSFVTRITSVDVLIDYLQVIAILGLIPVEWNSYVRETMNGISAFLGNWELGQLECLIPGFSPWFYSVAPFLMPVAFAGVYLVGSFGVFYYRALAMKNRWDVPQMPSVRYRAFNAFLMHLNFITPLMLVRSFQLLACTSAGEGGTSVLKFHSSAVCSGNLLEGPLAEPQIVGLIALAVYGFLVPLTLTIYVYVFKIRCETLWPGIPVDTSKHPLPTRYKIWWWIVVEHVRRVALIAAVVFWRFSEGVQGSIEEATTSLSSSASVISQGLAVLAVLFFAFVTEHYLEPRRSAHANLASAVATGSEYLVLLTGIGLQDLASPELEQARSIAQGAALVVGSFSLLVIAISEMMGPQKEHKPTVEISWPKQLEPVETPDVVETKVMGENTSDVPKVEEKVPDVVLSRPGLNPPPRSGIRNPPTIRTVEISPTSSPSVSPPIIPFSISSMQVSYPSGAVTPTSPTRSLEPISQTAEYGSQPLPVDITDVAVGGARPGDRPIPDTESRDRLESLIGREKAVSELLTRLFDTPDASDDSDESRNVSYGHGALPISLNTVTTREHDSTTASSQPTEDRDGNQIDSEIVPTVAVHAPNDNDRN